MFLDWAEGIHWSSSASRSVLNWSSPSSTSYQCSSLRRASCYIEDSLLMTPVTIIMQTTCSFSSNLNNNRLKTWTESIKTKKNCINIFKLTMKKISINSHEDYSTSFHNNIFTTTTNEIELLSSPYLSSTCKDRALF